MSEIRELSLNEIAMVSGGEGHGSEVNRDRQDAKMQHVEEVGEAGVRLQQQQTMLVSVLLLAL